MASHLVPMREMGIHELNLICWCRPQIGWTTQAGARVSVVRHRRQAEVLGSTAYMRRRKATS